MRYSRMNVRWNPRMNTGQTNRRTRLGKEISIRYLYKNRKNDTIVKTCIPK